jgi:hypothetical protein
MGINNGKRKWTRKTANAAPRFARNITFDRFVDGIVEASDGKLTKAQVEGSDAAKGYQNYAATPDSEKIAAYEAGVRGKEDKWERNWLRSFGG